MLTLVERAELVDRRHRSCWARSALGLRVAIGQFREHRVDNDDVRQNLTRAAIQIWDGRIERDLYLEVPEPLQPFSIALQFRDCAGPFPQLRSALIRDSFHARRLAGRHLDDDETLLIVDFAEVELHRRTRVLGVRTRRINPLRPVDVPKRDILRRGGERLRGRCPLVSHRHHAL